MQRAFLLIAVPALSVAIGVAAFFSARLPAADELLPPTLKLLKTFNDEFVSITPGEKNYPPSFIMGSEKGPLSEQPAHKVTFARRFFIAKYEVPQNLYETVMGQNP